MKSRKEIERIYSKWVVLPIITGAALLNLVLVVSFINHVVKMETEMAMACVSMFMCIVVGIIVGMKFMIIIIHDSKPDKISSTIGQSGVVIDNSSPIEPAR